MTFFIILTLLVSGNAGSHNNFQKKQLPNTEEIIQIVKQFIENDLEGEHTFLNDYTVLELSEDDTGTIGTFISSLASEMSYMRSHFTDKVAIYFDRLLLEYCQKALELLLQIPNRDYKSDIVSIVDHNFCVVAYIDVFRHKLADKLFQVSIFLQTISFYELRSINVKQSLLDFIRYNFVSDTKQKNISSTNVIEIIQELNSMKEKIKKFSNLFCLSSIQSQLVHKYTFSDVNKNENPFIHYTFQEEKCKIDTNILKPGNEMSLVPQSQKWDCSHILDTAEYGFFVYADYIRSKYNTITTGQYIKKLGFKFIKKTDDFFSKRECQLPGQIEHKPKKPSPTKFQQNLSGDNIISLSELKEKYKRNNTLNFWDFNIIITEVILHVSVKVGMQLLKGIKNVFAVNCGVYIVSITYQKISFLKAYLFMFKSLFDEFIIGLSNIHYFNVAERQEVKYFVKQVHLFTNIFEGIEYRNIRIKDACATIEDFMDDKLDAYRIGETPEFLFDEYYLTDPINYIYTLNKFDV